MSREPINWKDHIVEHPNRYRMTDGGDGTIELQREPGEILEQGTPVDARRLNEMDQAIIANEGAVAKKANKIKAGTAGNFIAVAGDGDIIDSGKNAEDFIPAASKGAINGVAALGADQKVPAEQLPLSGAVDSSSGSQAATSGAVKKAYDLAMDAVPKAEKAFFNKNITVQRYVAGVVLKNEADTAQSEIFKNASDTKDYGTIIRDHTLNKNQTTSLQIGNGKVRLEHKDNGAVTLSEIATKKDFVNDATTNQAGQYALDAVQANPNISGTLGAKIDKVNTDLTNHSQKFVAGLSGWTALQSDGDPHSHRLQLEKNGNVQLYQAPGSAGPWERIDFMAKKSDLDARTWAYCGEPGTYTLPRIGRYLLCFAHSTVASCNGLYIYSTYSSNYFAIKSTDITIEASGTTITFSRRDWAPVLYYCLLGY